jgi:hypothetical protein
MCIHTEMQPATSSDIKAPAHTQCLAYLSVVTAENLEVVGSETMRPGGGGEG